MELQAHTPSLGSHQAWVSSESLPGVTFWGALSLTTLFRRQTRRY